MVPDISNQPTRKVNTSSDKEEQEIILSDAAEDSALASGSESSLESQDEIETVAELSESGVQKDSVLFRSWYPGMVVEDLYRIEGEIARGGMGVIHKAKELATNNSVIIKSLLPKLAQDSECKKRFIREAEEWVKLGPHPNIVRAYTAHEIDYLPRIVAEYIEGGTLFDLLCQGLLPLRRALEIAAQICWGMAYAHQKGIAHRDLKPSNILLAKDGAAKVTDFGLVKNFFNDQPESENLELSNNENYEGTLLTMGVIGTPEYIAPEQWHGHGDKSSDIYAFGVILYELFCGKRPFDHSKSDGASRITAYRISHTKDLPPRPETLLTEKYEDLPVELIRLMQQCLEKSSDSRPSNFRILAQSLNQISTAVIGQNAAIEPSHEELDRQGKLDQGNAFIRLGHGCNSRGDYNMAENLFRKAKEIYESLNDQSGKANYYLGLGRLNYHHGNYAQSLKMYEKSLEISEDLDDKAGIAKCYYNMGLIKCQQAEYDQGMEMCQKSLQIMEALGDKAGIAACYNNMGIINERQSDFDRAMEMYKKSLEISEDLDDKAGIASRYTNMGLTKWKQFDYDQAMIMYQKSLEIMEALGDKAGLATCYNNMGLTKWKQFDYDQAMKMYQKSLKISEDLDDKAGIASRYNNMGLIKMDQGDYDQAMKMYQKSLEIKEEIGDIAGIALCNSNMSEIKIYQGDYDKAMEMCKKSLEIREALDDKTGKAHCFRNIGVIFKERTDYVRAEDMLQKSLKIAETMMHKELICESLQELGQVHSKQGQTSKALEVLNQCLSIMKEMDYHKQAEVQKLIDELSGKAE